MSAGLFQKITRTTARLAVTRDIANAIISAVDSSRVSPFTAVHTAVLDDLFELLQR